MNRLLLKFESAFFTILLLSFFYASFSYSAPLFKEEISTGELPSSKITRHRILKVEESPYGYVFIVIGLVKKGESYVRLETKDETTMLEVSMIQPNTVYTSYYPIERDTLYNTYIVAENKSSISDIYVALVKKLSSSVGYAVRVLVLLVLVIMTILIIVYFVRINRGSLRELLIGCFLGLFAKGFAGYSSKILPASDIICNYANTIAEYLLLKSLIFSLLDFVFTLFLLSIFMLYFEKKGNSYSGRFSTQPGLALGIVSLFVWKKITGLNVDPFHITLASSEGYLNILSAGSGHSQLYLPLYILEPVFIIFPLISALLVTASGVDRANPTLVLQGIFLLFAGLYVGNLFNYTEFYIQKPVWIHLLNLVFLNIAGFLFYLSRTRPGRVNNKQCDS